MDSAMDSLALRQAQHKNFALEKQLDMVYKVMGKDFTKTTAIMDNEIDKIFKELDDVYKVRQPPGYALQRLHYERRKQVDTVCLHVVDCYMQRQDRNKKLWWDDIANHKMAFVPMEMPDHVKFIHRAFPEVKDKFVSKDYQSQHDAMANMYTHGRALHDLKCFALRDKPLGVITGDYPPINTINVRTWIPPPRYLYPSPTESEIGLEDGDSQLVTPLPQGHFSKARTRMGTSCRSERSWTPSSRCSRCDSRTPPSKYKGSPENLRPLPKKGKTPAETAKRTGSPTKMKTASQDAKIDEESEKPKKGRRKSKKLIKSLGETPKASMSKITESRESDISEAIPGKASAPPSLQRDKAQRSGPGSRVDSTVGKGGSSRAQSSQRQSRRSSLESPEKATRRLVKKNFSLNLPKVKGARQENVKELLFPETITLPEIGPKVAASLKLPPVVSEHESESEAGHLGVRSGLWGRRKSAIGMPWEHDSNLQFPHIKGAGSGTSGGGRSKSTTASYLGTDRAGVDYAHRRYSEGGVYHRKGETPTFLKSLSPINAKVESTDSDKTADLKNTSPTEGSPKGGSPTKELEQGSHESAKTNTSSIPPIMVSEGGESPAPAEPADGDTILPPINASNNAIISADQTRRGEMSRRPERRRM